MLILYYYQRLFYFSTFFRWPSRIPPLAIYASIVFGVKSAIRTGSKIGKAGMITGIVGLSLCAFIYIGMALILILARM